MMTTDRLSLRKAMSSAFPFSASQILRASVRHLGIGKILAGIGKVLPVLIPLFTVAVSRAVTPDPKLVALVPPAAQMVAGLNVPPRSGQPSSFLLSTHNNKIDMSDFIALWGIDSSRAIEQIIVVASKRGDIVLAEHSLLAIGHFDQARIYKSSYRAGAKPINYRGISVLEIQPFARERDDFHDVRWLAMMDSKLALFGTIGIVQQELDRYLDYTAADPSLVQKLAHLRHDDATWCVATIADHNSESAIQSMFQILDVRLATLLHVGDTIEFGIHYGRRVEFEYEVVMRSSHGPEAVQGFLESSLTEQNGGSLLRSAEIVRTDNGVRGVLKVSKERYESWIAEAFANIYMRGASGTSPR